MKKIKDLDKNTLRKLYIEKEYSSGEIANMYNCTSPGVLYRIEKYNIKKRSQKESCNTDRYREKLSEARKGKNNPQYGISPTKETRNKISRSVEQAYEEGRLERKISKKHKEKLIGKNHYLYGKRLPKETREKISKSNKGRKFSKQTREKISNSLKEYYLRPENNKTNSPETRLKMRLSAIQRINDNLKEGNQMMPNYNPSACRKIEKYGELNGYNFQHAENGGEVHIKDLGY